MYSFRLRIWFPDYAALNWNTSTFMPLLLTSTRGWLQLRVRKDLKKHKHSKFWAPALFIYLLLYCEVQRTKNWKDPWFSFVRVWAILTVDCGPRRKPKHSFTTSFTAWWTTGVSQQAHSKERGCSRTTRTETSRCYFILQRINHQICGVSCRASTNWQTPIHSC